MNSTDTAPDYRTWPNSVAAVMMTIDAVLGIFFSGSIVYIFAKDSQQKTSFNLICTIRAFNNIMVIITAFFMVYIPGSLLGYSVLPVWLDSFLVCSSINLYMLNEFQSIFISVNRFIAIYLPVYYNILCGHRATLIVHFILYADRCRNIAFETYIRTEKEQFITFSSDYLMFTSINVYGGGLVYVGAIFFGTALLLNIFTFVRITLFYLKSTSRSDPENMKNIKKNMKLFFQTVLQDILFFVDNFFTYFMSSLIKHRFWYFICATFVWQTMLVIDGFVMIMFNDRLSLLKNAIFSSSSPPISVIAENSSMKTPQRRLPLPDVS